MAYFAKINAENIVEAVIVADDISWVNETQEGNWVETFEGDYFAGIGWTWDQENSVFITPMPTCGHEEISFNATTFTWECGNGIHDEPIS
jgi:hypothetical protein